jgi:hypothetical protein
MSWPVSSADDTKGVSQSWWPRSASVGRYPISTGQGGAEPHHRERQRSNSLTKHPAAPTSAQRPEPESEPPPPPVSPEEQLQTDINAILVQAPGSISLEQCTRPQQTFIIRYGMDMIRDGNKPEWAAQVCASIAILYQSGIEAHIPDRIDIENNQQPYCIEYFRDAKEGTVFGQRFIEQRANATAALSVIMTVNGADYGIISDYLKQQRFSSWDNKCCVMKYFLLQQRMNPEQDANNIYYFGGNKRSRHPTSLDTLNQRYDEYFQPNDLNTYTKTVAMYKAYTAIALGKTQFSGKDQASNSCTLQRAMTRQLLITSYGQAYENVRVNETFDRMKGGIADSTALGPPVYHFIEPGSDIFEMQVPFSKIHAAYFISPELCYDDIPKEKQDVKFGFAGGHEFVCDLGKIKLKLIRQAAK